MTNSSIDSIAETARPGAPTLEGFRLQIARLPLTMRPALNQQLANWPTLFPFECNRLVSFLGGVEQLDPPALDRLTEPLRELEAKMGVHRWPFSESADTMENASLLARSEFYTEWRAEVQRVFSAIEQAAHRAASPPDRRTRLVLCVLPESLPVAPLDLWKPWDRRGRIVRIDGDARRIAGLALGGALGLAAQFDATDCWLIDADSRLSTLAGAGPVSLLDYTALRGFRDRFLEEVNRIPKNIQASDDLLAQVRRIEWERWWPASQPNDPRLRAFLIDLFLSGNGALVFSNAFVQWAASEALRRARPRLVVAHFGMRARPKPFTGIAIFENQQKISALPDVDDSEGSAVDALILARYVWLAASRYPENERGACVCVAENRNQVYLVAPEGAGPALDAGSGVTPEALAAWMRAHLAG